MLYKNKWKEHSLDFPKVRKMNIKLVLPKVSKMTMNFDLSKVVIWNNSYREQGNLKKSL